MSRDRYDDGFYPTDKAHWYKTSPHDDRWGSFNPFNMGHISKTLKKTARPYVALFVVVWVITFVGWYVVEFLKAVIGFFS